jgi:hypothetical protein
MVKITGSVIAFSIIGLFSLVVIAYAIYKFTTKKKCEKGSGCENKECGPDSCGNSDMCGKCGEGQVCNSLGKCVCQPNCKPNSCGSDGCGGICGTCITADPQKKYKAFCIGEEGNRHCCDQYFTCKGKNCGDDGCGNPDGCGTCPPGKECDGGICKCCWIDPKTKKRVCQVCSDDETCCIDPKKCTQGLGCKSSNCDGKTCGDDGASGSCGSCKENETCVNGVCKCGTLDSCADFCTKDSSGKYKCCPKPCNTVDLNHCGTDECTGERCYCPVGFNCYGTECLCGPNKLKCGIDSLCLRMDYDGSYICAKDFYIKTPYGFLTNIIENSGNGVIGIKIVSSVPENVNLFASYTYPERSHLEMYTDYKNKKTQKIYVDYDSKINQISTKKGSFIQLSKNNTLIYRKPGHGARFYLTVYKNSKGVYYVIPGEYYSGFVFI